MDIKFLGVLPYADLRIEEEDSLSDEDKRVYLDNKEYINISVIKTKRCQILLISMLLNSMMM